MNKAQIVGFVAQLYSIHAHKASLFQAYNSPMWHHRHKLKSPGRLSVLVVVILCIGVILTVLNIYQLQQMKLEHSSLHDQPAIIEPTPGHGGSRSPVVWIHGKRVCISM